MKEQFTDACVFSMHKIIVANFQQTNSHDNASHYQLFTHKRGAGGGERRRERKTLFTHTQYDINIDHRACYFATLTATRPIQNQCVKEVILFEVPSSTEWYFPSQFSPNIFIDISSEISTKIKVLKFHKNEIKDFPHPDQKKQ